MHGEKEKGITAEIKEIVVQSDALELQNALPELREDAFDIAVENWFGCGLAVRTWCPRSVTLFTSGYPLDILEERGLLTTGYDEGEFLQKPFLPRDLREMIDAAENVANARIFSAGGAR